MQDMDKETTTRNTTKGEDGYKSIARCRDPGMDAFFNAITLNDGSRTKKKKSIKKIKKEKEKKEKMKKKKKKKKNEDVLNSNRTKVFDENEDTVTG